MEQPAQSTPPNPDAIVPRFGLCNFTATTDPGIHDDLVAGYGYNSEWYNTSGVPTLWKCVDPSQGAAIWKQIGLFESFLFLNNIIGGGANHNGILYAGVSGELAVSPTIGSGDSIRRNGADTAFEAFTPVAGPTVDVAHGGTGQSSYTNGQLLIGNTTGNTLTKATLTGTANQITVTNGPGAITLSLPQNIATNSAPTFDKVKYGAGGAMEISSPNSDMVVAVTGQTGIFRMTPFGSDVYCDNRASGALIFRVNEATSAIEGFRVDSSGKLGIGATSPSAKVHILSTTTPQLRQAYDGSNYNDISVGSNGLTTYGATGSGALHAFINPLRITSTSTQLTARYDATHSVGLFMDNSGNATFDIDSTGATKFVFNDDLHGSGDIECDTVGSGFIVKSPDSTRWRITVNNLGVLVTTAA